MNPRTRKLVLVGVVTALVFVLVYFQYQSSKKTTPSKTELSVDIRKASKIELPVERKASRTELPVERKASKTELPVERKATNTELPAGVPKKQTLNFQHRRRVTSLSKDLIIHSAYFDSRPRDGYSNVSVLFANVNKTILNQSLIVGCGAEGVMALNFSVYSIFENELMHRWFGPNHVFYYNMLILCYDLSARNGSSVFVVYKTSSNSSLYMVTYSRQPLFHPAPRVSSKTDKVTVVVCSKAHNKKAPWFREFIQYQRALGVDHIDFSVLHTFITDDGYDKLVLNDPVVLRALEEGFINFRVWPESYEKEGEAYFHSENLRKLACIYRYMGTYDYAMPMDTDDFFMPRSKEMKLKDYIMKYCYTPPAASCRVYWVHMYPECGMLGKAGNDGNVTALLKSNTMKNSFNYKSIHKTTAILDASFHDARCKNCMVPGTNLVHIGLEVAYVAHMRFSDNEKDRKGVISKVCPHVH